MAPSRRSTTATATNTTTAPALQTLLKDAALAGTWTLDPAKSTVGLKSRSMWGLAPVKGVFRQVSGGGTVGRDGAVSGTVTVAAASVDTRIAKRDAHLRSADFFDAEKYPYMTFEVTGIERIDEDNYKLRGDLTIKETTRPLELKGTIEGRLADPFGGKERLGVSATGQLNRMDFGLNWDGVAGAVPFAGHQIKLAIDAEIVVKAVEAAAA